MINRVMPRLIYGEGHAYSNPASGSGTAEAVGSLTSAELQAFYKRWVRPDNSLLLVVGDTTLAAVQPLLEARLGGWKAPAEALPKKNITEVALAAKPRVFLIDRPGAEQSQIMAATVGPTRADPDHIRFVALDTMLGGNFVSRLNMNLREDKHWAYGAGTRITDAIGQGMFRAGAGVQTDKTAESMVEIRKEMRDILGSKKPTAAELKFAQDSIAIALPGNNETSDEIANSYGEILTFGSQGQLLERLRRRHHVTDHRGRQQVRGPARSPGRADMGGGWGPVEDRGEGARAESRRSHGHRRGRQGAGEIARCTDLRPPRRAPSTASAPHSR